MRLPRSLPVVLAVCLASPAVSVADPGQAAPDAQPTPAAPADSAPRGGILDKLK